MRVLPKIRQMLLLMITACMLVTGCGGTAQVTEDAQSGDVTETAALETADITADGTINPATETMEETTAETAAPEDVFSVEEWLNYQKSAAEERDGWILTFRPLNVRRFCYANGTVIGSFDAGQKITVTGPLKYGFYPVRGTDLETGAEITGYCSADYITFLEYDSPEIRLDITRYSQTDGRWSNIKLGSKYTVGEIGCTTTCFSMCESYLTDTVITPADMVEMLTYTRGGDLYWPDGYKVQYGSDYLSVIYQKLHQGIPVLIGSRRGNGSQHWVLVTGYDPGNKEITAASQLKASDFIINDPGKGRTTLGQFLKDLPYVIKFVYYVGPEGIATQHVPVSE